MAQKKIEIQVSLNAQQQPDHIELVTDSGSHPAKAMVLHFYAADQPEAMRIDLWNHDFQVREMDLLVYQMLHSVAEMYQRATTNRELSEEIHGFAEFFGEKTLIVDPGQRQE